jgi:hypothetical protein
MHIKWKPQGVVKGGTVIQHIVVKKEFSRKKEGDLLNDDEEPFWEAWEVDKEGNVYSGYMLPDKVLSKGDIFGQHVEQKKSRGFVEVIGYARYVDGYYVNWRAGGVDDANGLPSTKKMPEGWSDNNTLKHGFKITWNDFECEPPKIVESWQ